MTNEAKAVNEAMRLACENATLRARVAELEEVMPELYSAALIFNHDGDSIWDAKKDRVLKVMPSLTR